LISNEQKFHPNQHKYLRSAIDFQNRKENKYITIFLGEKSEEEVDALGPLPKHRQLPREVRLLHLLEILS